MKYLYVHIIIILSTLPAFAQEGPTMDISNSVIQQEADTVKQNLDSLKDTLNPGKILSIQDSLHDHPPISKLVSIKAAVGNITTPDSIGFINPLDTLKLTNTIGQVKDSVKQKYSTLKNKIHLKDSLQLLKNMHLELPNDLPQINIDPEITGKLPESIYAEDIPELDINSKDYAIPELKIKQLEGLKNTEVNTAVEIKEKMQGKFQETEQIKGEIGAFQEQVNGFKVDSTYIEQKAEQLVQDQLSDKAEMDVLAEKGELADDLFKEQFNQVQYLKQLNGARGAASADWIAKKVKNVSFDKLEEHKDKIAGAQDKLAKAKKKYGEFSNLKELDTLKAYKLHVPFWQRITPSVNFQIEKKENTGIFFSPQVGYRFNEIITGGLGYTYKIEIEEKFKSLSLDPSTYGPKGLIRIKAFKSYHGQMEYEYLRTSIAIIDEPVNREWVSGLNLGVVKEFTFKGAIKGKLQVMYNVLYNEEKAPFQKPLMIRFGIGLELLKSLKKTNFRKGLKDKVKGIHQQDLFEKAN